MVLGRVTVSYERGTPVNPEPETRRQVKSNMVEAFMDPAPPPHAKTPLAAKKAVAKKAVPKK